ncbi:MAG: antibiotic biosynthesis monooxygenase [Candidatus Eremiobacteraeota bacterium]|nr:antibiotic biosynthesis monooxygenase [Candidatus Eremiobacteraeota bacterium]
MSHDPTPRAKMLRTSALWLTALAAAASPAVVSAATSSASARKTGVTVLAKVTAKPGMGDQLHDVFLGLVAPARKDAGNISYDLVRGVDDPLTFVSIECWADAASLQAHLKTPPITDAIAKLGSIVAGPPEIVSYTMVSDPV